MKILLGILLFLLCWVPVCHSQITSTDTVRLTKLPSEGILLDKGWKFHADDDSAWANPEFNDRDWQSINPALDIRHIPQIQNVSIFWLRLKLLVDSSMMDQPLGMSISQVGASEIYLDGIPVYKFGTISKNRSEIRTHFLLNNPFSMKLGSNRVQTIAIRYSYDQKVFLIKWGFDNYCMHMVVNSVQTTFSTYQKNVRVSSIYEITKCALWMLLCIFSFGLYFVIRSQKEYFFIGIYSLFLFISNILGGLIARELSDTSAYAYTYFLSRLFLILGVMVVYSVLFRLYNQNKNWYYYALMACSFFAIISYFIFYDQATSIFLAVFVLLGFEFSRRSWKAIKNNRPGATLLFLAATTVFFFAPLMIFLLRFNFLATAAFVAFLAEISIPFYWSLFIAGEFGRTGLALQARVIEVEQLSEKAVSQEREKQQFLALQNETLESKVSERTSELNESLRNLKSTQAQLIQSEKMASLGELTAGIAHEIQNPLNFVNNFSDLNKELIDEVSKANEDGNSMGVKELLSTLKDNEEKIYHHGKRADAIVKGMLQHSRTSTGQKESIDLNRLVDEYLRIAYQGMRTRDNSFNTKIETHYDQDIKRVNIIPQDIGRVLLNLYNNAFYTVMEKKKRQSELFEPTLTVTTIKTEHKVEVRVKDNGNGIPKKILDKIFQPFFTTKPTGQGTGLGLSLSYDILKVHGGEIKVETEEGKYSEFTILLHT
ncbi:MAG TPA: ATP-binding protein [Puia sp.]|nr:ATP-binding protein [Puia sp.]